MGDDSGAVADYTSAIRLMPDYVDAYNNRGLSKFALGDNKSAAEDYCKAIELNPEYADAYYNYGIVKYEMGDTKGACAEWEKAGKHGYAEAYETIKKYCK